MEKPVFSSISKNFSVFAQSESVLFQFILSEFLDAKNKTKKIEELYNELENIIISKRFQSSAVNPILLQLFALLSNLTGNQIIIAQEEATSSNYAQGTLSKLYYYARLFCQKKTKDNTAVDLKIAVNKAFHSTLQMKEIIITVQQQNEQNLMQSYFSVCQLLDKLIDNIGVAARLILKLLLLSKDDENVLRLMINRHAEFDKAYGSQFVLKVLKKMYPQGLKYAKDFILERFARRGFSYLLDPTSALIAKLEQQ